MKRFIFIIAVMFSVLSVKGQQDPQYTQYMYNMNIVNPGYAGAQDGLVLSFLARSQWVGIKDAPRTLTFNAQAPIGSNLGLGLSVLADRIGPLSEENVYADISYSLDVSEQAKLAFGLKAGATFLSAPLAFLTTVNSGDIAFQNNLNEVKPNFGAGVYYYTDKYYLGLSVPNVLKTVHFERNNGVISKALDEMHYFFTGGYVFEFDNDIKFKPSFLVKAAVGAPISVDYNANILFNNNLEFGLSYRFDDSFSAMLGLNVTDQLRIGYAYDHTFTNLGNFNSGSHEILMTFSF
ncbi:PorP/SprF family type IX secretion system membrane protein, partial [Tenacibaculum amylolyticum]|uniref:PorP/SprF family type IX secretion system membrane protein n=1 Tax=Tenacibaculum amylolyticum TaxID=104269 RepID=UPI0038B69F78